MAKNNARLYDPTALIQAGINPKTGLPIKLVDEETSQSKEEIRKQLRILDEQNAVNRYTWYNQPLNLSSQEIERLIYYRGQLCFFYLPELDKFFLMPYALNGTIDFYGRYNEVHPVPFIGGTTEDEKNLAKNQLDYLSTISLKVLYDIPDEPIDFFEGKHCVLLHDYTKQLSQTTIARQILQDPILDIEAELIPFMHTALLNATGIAGMRVGSQDEYAAVEEASRALNKAALRGKKWVPVVGYQEFQDLTGGETAKAEEFLLAMQGIDNYRLSLYGLDNGGLYQKKAHMLESEQEMNAGCVSMPLQDGLSIRQRFCDIVNFLTDAGMSCEVSEVVLGADMNCDGAIMDENDQSGTIQGDQDHTMVGDENNG